MSGPKYSRFLVSAELLIKAYTGEELEIKSSIAKRKLKQIDDIIKTVDKSLKYLDINSLSNIPFKNEKDKVNATKEMEAILNRMKANSLIKDYESLKTRKTPYFNSLEKKYDDAILLSLKVARVKELVFNLLKDKYNVTLKNEKVETTKETSFNANYTFLHIPNDFFLDEDNITDLVNIDLMLENLEKYNNIYHLSKKNRQVLLESYQNINNILSYDITNKDKAIRIKAEYENFMYLIPSIEHDENEFNELYDNASILISKMNLDYKEIDNAHTLDEIKDLYNKLLKYFEEHKDIYTSNAITEVMSDLGYNVLHSDCLKEDLNEQYFKYDEESAISVYRSKEGSCVIELVNTGYEDEMTDNEVKLHLDKMHKFCDKYPNILKQLESKGIKVEKNAEMPVNKAFVKHVVTKKGHKNNAYTEKKYKEM